MYVLILILLGFVTATAASVVPTALNLFHTFGVVAGFVAALVGKSFNLAPCERRKTAIYAGLAYPGICLLAYGVASIVSPASKTPSDDAGSMHDRPTLTSPGVLRPNETVPYLLLLWMVNVALARCGGHWARTRRLLLWRGYPFREEPLPIPQQPWYSRLAPTCLAGGIPVAAGGVLAAWLCVTGAAKPSFLWGSAFMLVAVLSFIASCATVSIGVTLLQLRNGDYRWWWRSFATSAFGGVYVFVSCMVVKPYAYLAPSMAHYCAFAFIGSLGFALLAGTSGFCASFLLVPKIYSRRSHIHEPPRSTELADVEEHPSAAEAPRADNADGGSRLGDDIEESEEIRLSIAAQ
mmetsp:Transcript_19175/g.36999  ORF Transcript_19175/g.36999 Transcript_19175/m.36999 type:complete len:350 (+) Transcript_19175:427-1476(+)